MNPFVDKSGYEITKFKHVTNTYDTNNINFDKEFIPYFDPYVFKQIKFTNEIISKKCILASNKKNGVYIQYGYSNCTLRFKVLGSC